VVPAAQKSGDTAARCRCHSLVQDGRQGLPDADQSRVAANHAGIKRRKLRSKPLATKCANAAKEGKKVWSPAKFRGWNSRAARAESCASNIAWRPNTQCQVSLMMALVGACETAHDFSLRAHNHRPEDSSKEPVSRGMWRDVSTPQRNASAIACSGSDFSRAGSELCHDLSRALSGTLPQGGGGS